MDNCDSHSGSLWLPLALTCSLRLSLALSGSYWISPCLSLALYGSLWLPLWLSLALTATLWHTLALSGSLLLSNFAYTALDRLTGPLLGSHRRCHDDALYPALPWTNNPLCASWISKKTCFCETLLGKVSRKKLLFFWILSKLLPPNLGNLCNFFWTPKTSI